jgi:hypothetical protein
MTGLPSVMGRREGVLLWPADNRRDKRRLGLNRQFVLQVVLPFRTSRIVSRCAVPILRHLYRGKGGAQPDFGLSQVCKRTPLRTSGVYCF